MALTEAKGTREEQERTERFAAARREAKAQAAAEEAALTSEERTLEDGGTQWTYVIYSDEEARILGCQTTDVVVAVPAEVEGKPTRCIATEAMANLSTMEEVTLPAGIIELGAYVFRNCANLKKVAMPCEVKAYDPTWFSNCHKIEELVLPNGLTELKPRVFDLSLLKKLTIGAATAVLEPGMFAKSKLESIAIDPANTALKTDGLGIYSADGSSFIALAIPCESYEIAQGCTTIAKKALSNFSGIKEVSIPDTVEVIEDFAFARTGVESFKAPAALKSLGNQAFGNCKQLKEAALNEGLETIGDEVFSGTALQKLTLPKTVRYLGNKVTARTPLTYSGPDATFKIDHDCPALMLDEQGCLYAVLEDGMHLVRMLDPDYQDISVAEGTTVIGIKAFLKHAGLRSVVLPEGVKTIQESAFSGCRKLTHVEVPSTLEKIEKEAFLDTSIEAIRIPAALREIGTLALTTCGAHHDECAPALHDIQVDADSTHFYKASGLLCERMEDGGSRVVVYDGSDPNIDIPEEVTAIMPYALNGAVGIESLRVRDSVKNISVRSMAFDCHIKDIYIETAEPLEGHTEFHFAFPNTERGQRQQCNAFGVMKAVDVPAIYHCYDLTISNATSLDAGEEFAQDLYNQIKLLFARMKDPIFLAPVTKDTINKLFGFHMEEVCSVIARFEDLDAAKDLCDLGYLTAENLPEAVKGADAFESKAVLEYLKSRI